MRLFFVLCTTVVITGQTLAFPRYHATKIDSGIGFNSLDGFSNDGAIMYAKPGYGAGVLYNGEFHSIHEITGRYVDYQVTIRAHDIFSGNFFGGGGLTYYKGNLQVTEQASGSEQEAIGCINSNGDYVGSHYKPGPLNSNYDDGYTFLVHNGVRTIVDPVGNKASFPTWLSDSGYVCGIRGNHSYATNQDGTGWYGSPGDANTIGLGNLLLDRVNESGNMVGHTYSGGAYVHLLSGTEFQVKGPDGDYHTSGPDINNLNQVVCTVGARKPLVYWENGQSAYMDTLVDNAEVLPDLKISGLHWFSGKINDSGTIVAVLPGAKINNSYVSDLWRFDPVPEPSSVLILGVGTAALLRRRSKQGH